MAKSNPGDYRVAVSTIQDMAKERQRYSVTNGAIEDVAAAYYANLKRSLALLHTPALAWMLGVQWETAYFNVTREMERKKVGFAAFRKGTDIAKRMMTEMDSAIARMPPEEMGNLLDSATIDYSLFANQIPQAKIGIDAMLQSLTVQAWMAFETLAGDLWIASLNDTPRLLAQLGGKPKRIAMKAGGDQADTTESGGGGGGQSQSKQGKQDKQVSLSSIDAITEGKYDLSKLMGTMFHQSGRVSFITLSGIREAYSVAFSEKCSLTRSDGIDDALASRSLDTLCALRNVIAHRSCKADKKYLDDIRGLESAPRPDKHGVVHITGKQFAEMLMATSDISARLIQAVDLCLAKIKDKASRRNKKR